MLHRGIISCTENVKSVLREISYMNSLLMSFQLSQQRAPIGIKDLHTNIKIWKKRLQDSGTLSKMHFLNNTNQKTQNGNSAESKRTLRDVRSDAIATLIQYRFS